MPVSRRFVMFSAVGVGFPASEPVRASLVFFHASLGSEIDNAITLLHAAPSSDVGMIQPEASEHWLKLAQPKGYWRGVHATSPSGRADVRFGS